MNKIKLMGATLLTAVTITGCQGGDETGLGNNGDNGLQPVRYNNTTDIAPNRERINMDGRDLGPQYNNENNRNIDNGNRDDINGQFNNNDTPRNMNNTNDGNNNDADGHNQYDVADRAADRITDEIKEVDQAYVFAGNENAYVAVAFKGDQNDEVTDKLKNRISKVVKATDEDIDDVFVSANPEFFNQAGDYADQIENGDPIEGLFNEMGDMFQRIFPTDNDQ
ncbi:YhcN/YlaJ family sporulation lipoprotein [Virgibacillus sp. MSP4-1]|uniref:YhcN/YlaJ family sporulation lipoprotein n=1 Tax=Virgibacillus sp. MSP4-1 TaxID=2700081 RepID=UPI0003A8ACD0|nr:YhcN/YlaJ family sporulation lipoprotein [Virgibacillus sp. MSP4-1]QHS21562.1 YhcN/YlaJ family sporulation lipoprotein [Virgibacillus sp. MSP4-1]